MTLARARRQVPLMHAAGDIASLPARNVRTTSMAEDLCVILIAACDFNTATVTYRRL